MTNNLIINLIDNLDQLIIVDKNIGFSYKTNIIYNINQQTNLTRTFFIGKTIINSALPNQGTIFGYALSDNILKLSYNYCLKKKEESPFILKHNFKLFNNYYNFNLTKFNKLENKIDIIEDKFQINIKTTKDEISLIENNNKSNIEQEQKVAESSIQKDISVDTKNNDSSLNEGSSSSNDSLPSINNSVIDSSFTLESKNNSSEIFLFNDQKIIIRDNKIIQIANKTLEEPMILINTDNLLINYYCNNNNNKFIKCFFNLSKIDTFNSNFYRMLVLSNVKNNKTFIILSTLFNNEENLLDRGNLDWFLRKITEDINFLEKTYMSNKKGSMFFKYFMDQQNLLSYKNNHTFIKIQYLRPIRNCEYEVDYYEHLFYNLNEYIMLTEVKKILKNIIKKDY